MPKINDLDLKNWKEYSDILTDSFCLLCLLWLNSSLGGVP